MSIDGDAMNGYIRSGVVDGRRVLHYYLVRHGMPVEVSRGTWIYSAVHSVSIWITVGAVLLSMLTLAKDRIISSMRSSIVRGRTFITILATVVTLISLAVTMWFLLYMIRQLADPSAGPL
jgi:heme/copper-type cytochrome/quinol oxidase subunit 2